MKAALTGGPCVGKTTIGRRLAALGYPFVSEIATEVIEQGLKNHIPGFLPWVDHISFQWEVLQRQIRAEAAVADCTLPVFFDRGVYDAIAYRLVHGWKVQGFLQRLLPKQYDIVFIFPPMGTWEADGIRYEDPLFTREITPVLRYVYKKQGIPDVLVPDGTIEERTRFILDTVKRCGRKQRRTPATVSNPGPAVYLPTGPRSLKVANLELVHAGAGVSS